MLGITICICWPGVIELDFAHGMQSHCYIGPVVPGQEHDDCFMLVDAHNMADVACIMHGCLPVQPFTTSNLTQMHHPPTVGVTL